MWFIIYYLNDDNSNRIFATQTYNRKYYDEYRVAIAIYKFITAFKLRYEITYLL